MELNLPINSQWATIFNLVVAKDISDLHISSGEMPKAREKLALVNLGEQVITKEEVLEGLENIFLEQEQYELLKQQGSLDFRCTYQGYSFRGNVFSTYKGYAMALRKIPKQAFPLSNYASAKVLWEMVSQARGLVLICGATGTGKSSTLAALLEEVNHSLSKHIITLEDPIEYLFQGGKALIQQRELGKDFPNFPQGIKMALRQDPDLIMVGEIRDKVTMAAAMEAAETGHLVLGTLHAGTTVEAISRVVAFFEQGEAYARRQQLAQILTGVVAQQLVLHQDRLHCVMEVLLPISAVRNLIRQNKDEQIISQIQLNSNLGMVTMEQALRKLKGGFHG